MNKIKFSHRYEKMPKEVENRETLLLEVLSVDKKELSENFIKYDTGYIINDVDDESEFKRYPLPKGKLIILVLLTHCGDFAKNMLWTTIRRWTPEKEKYYRSIRGEQVEIVVEEQK